MTKALSFVRSVWANFLESGGLDTHVLSNMAITAATPGRVVSEMTIEKHHTVRFWNISNGIVVWSEPLFLEPPEYSPWGYRGNNGGLGRIFSGRI
jgi:hypothetical protein